VAGRAEPVLVSADSRGFGPPVWQDWKIIAVFRRPEPVARRVQWTKSANERQWRPAPPLRNGDNGGSADIHSRAS